MNDTATPETNGQNAAANASYEKLENSLEAMIVSLELYKAHDEPIPSFVFAALSLAGPLMLNTLAQKYQWSTDELLGRLHEQRRKLHEQSDPMAQLGALLETAVEGGAEVRVHAVKDGDIDKLKAAIKSGDAKTLDAVIAGIVDKKEN